MALTLRRIRLHHHPGAHRHIERQQRRRAASAVDRCLVHCRAVRGGYLRRPLGPVRIFVVAHVIGMASLCMLGVGSHSSTLWLLAAAAAAFGISYGVVQTETIVVTYCSPAPVASR